jgi:hypothetical protein
LPTAKAAPLPTAKAAPAPPSSKARPQVPVVEAVETDEIKKQKLRKELKRIERQEERAEEDYEELREECRYGRYSTMILSWAMRGCALGVIFMIITAIAVTFAPAEVGLPVFLFTLGLGIVTSLLILSGFGFALKGPEAGRHLGIIGLIVTFLHAGIVGAELIYAFKSLSSNPYDPQNSNWAEFARSAELYGSLTNFSILSEQPACLLKQYRLSAFGLAGAALEFTRLVMICLLAQNYASAGRERELAHASMETVSRIFWTILLSSMFRISAAFLFDHAAPEELWAKVGLGVHGALTVFTLLAIAFFLFKQFQVLLDTADVCDPRRFSLNAE